MKKVMPYVHWRTICFGETDAAGIVYTTRFTDYCMEAAEVWFREYLDSDWYQLNRQHERGTPVVHMELDFMASLIGNDKLGVRVLVKKVGKSTVTLEFEGNRVRNGSDDTILCYTATIVFCFFSNATAGAMAIPEQQLQLLENYCQGCKSTDNV